MLICVISWSHTLFPELFCSCAPSTAAPYQSLARCCLTQSFLKLLSPCFEPPPPLISCWPGFQLCPPLSNLPPSVIQALPLPSRTKNKNLHLAPLQYFKQRFPLSSTLHYDAACSHAMQTTRSPQKHPKLFLSLFSLFPDLHPSSRVTLPPL